MEKWNKYKVRMKINKDVRKNLATDNICSLIWNEHEKEFFYVFSVSSQDGGDNNFLKLPVICSSYKHFICAISTNLCSVEHIQTLVRQVPSPTWFQNIFKHITPSKAGVPQVRSGLQRVSKSKEVCLGKDNEEDGIKIKASEDDDWNYIWIFVDYSY